MEINPSNQDEFVKANSELDQMIQKMLLEKLRDNQLNINDYRILSRTYSMVSNHLFVESALQVLENRI